MRYYIRVYPEYSLMFSEQSDKTFKSLVKRSIELKAKANLISMLIDI